MEINDSSNEKLSHFNFEEYTKGRWDMTLQQKKWMKWINFHLNFEMKKLFYAFSEFSQNEKIKIIFEIYLKVQLTQPPPIDIRWRQLLKQPGQSVSQAARKPVS